MLEQREYNNNAHTIRSSGIHKMAHIPKRKRWHLCIRRFALVLMKSDDDAEKTKRAKASE